MNLNKKKPSTGMILLRLLGATALYNHVIFMRAGKNAPKKNTSSSGSSHYFHWVCGDIHYTKSGSGKPILLVHSLNPASAGFEWNKVIPILSGSRTVYTLDLMGCGASDKPYRTYTSFFYMQMIKDFIREVIGEPTDVAAIGSSAGFVTGACVGAEKLFKKLIFISPIPPAKSNALTELFDRLYHLCVRTPVLGTLLYNIEYSRFLLKFRLENFDFFKKESCSEELLDTCYYHAHRRGYGAKTLFASITGGFLSMNLTKALQTINHRMLLIVGRNAPSAKEIMSAYRDINPRIDTKIINNTRDLIPLENHLAVANAILDYLSA